MLPVLQFVFQDFWHWFGTFLIVVGACEGIGRIGSHWKEKE